MQEELDEIARAHDNEDYNLWAEVYDEDMGEGQVYYSGGASMSLQINLGWPAMEIGRDEPGAAGHGAGPGRRIHSNGSGRQRTRRCEANSD